MSKEELCKRAKQAIIDFDEEAAEKVAHDVIAAGINPVEVINEGFTPGMTQVGDLFNDEEVPLPYVIVAAEAMIKAINIMEPHIPSESKGQKKGTVVIGTVEGDIHDIGKGIVATMLKVYGFEVHDLGRDVPAKAFVDKAKEVNADIIASSTLMTTTLIGQKEIEQELIKAGLKDRVKTMVGGAPVNINWANKIGANAYGENTNDAIRLAKELTS
ncbi:MAG: corrinoid protein [Clostridia bacterium]|jgi:trimethylamine corrinoid protein|nr:corrinoid protein [Clostridia bacterium]